MTVPTLAILNTERGWPPTTQRSSGLGQHDRLAQTSAVTLTAAMTGAPDYASIASICRDGRCTVPINGIQAWPCRPAHEVFVHMKRPSR
jgi:hypothetical protein